MQQPPGRGMLSAYKDLAIHASGHATCGCMHAMFDCRCWHPAASQIDRVQWKERRDDGCLHAVNTLLTLKSVCMHASGPRRPGEGTEDEEQGVVSAEETATGYVAKLVLTHATC